MREMRLSNFNHHNYTVIYKAAQIFGHHIFATISRLFIKMFKVHLMFQLVCMYIHVYN